MDKSSSIYVHGHRGFVGSAVVKELERKGYANWNVWNKADFVFNCAVYMGDDRCRVKVIAENLKIQRQIFEKAHYNGAKLLNIASSSVYPIDGKQPYTEDMVGTGKTDPAWPYAIAKIAGIELARAYRKQYGCNFITTIPCGMYGPGMRQGVVLDLIKKFCESGGKPVELKGDGSEKREFLYVDDFASAAVMLMEEYSFDDLHEGVVNIGYGKEYSIRNLASLIKMWALSESTIMYDEKSNGVASRLMDSSLMNQLGWISSTPLTEGIKKTYRWYLENRPCDKSGKN